MCRGSGPRNGKKDKKKKIYIYIFLPLDGDITVTDPLHLPVPEKSISPSKIIAYENKYIHWLYNMIKKLF